MQRDHNFGDDGVDRIEHDSSTSTAVFSQHDHRNVFSGRDNTGRRYAADEC